MDTMIPHTKNETFAQLDAMLSEMDKKELVSRDAIEFHFTLGMGCGSGCTRGQERCVISS